MTAEGSIYGKALYLLAREENLCEQILCELKTVRSLFAENPEYITLLDFPSVRIEDRTDAVKAALSGMSEYVVNLLCILTEKRRAQLFSAAAKEFERLFDEENGILKVTAITAVPLSQSQKEAIAIRLTAEIVGTKQVIVDNKIDPSILGGLILQYAGRQTDASVALQLKTLQQKIASASI